MFPPLRASQLQRVRYNRRFCFVQVRRVRPTSACHVSIHVITRDVIGRVIASRWISCSSWECAKDSQEIQASKRANQVDRLPSLFVANFKDFLSHFQTKSDVDESTASDVKVESESEATVARIEYMSGTSHKPVCSPSSWFELASVNGRLMFVFSFAEVRA